jgi:aerobic carbon-monoxide dehydrogenase large subunit
MHASHHKTQANTYIGSPIERIEDYRFLRGEGQYVADLSFDGQVHAVIVRSPIAHGLIKKIDTHQALAMPGVIAVLTADDIGADIPTIPFRRPNPTIGPYAQPIIARHKVRYFGEPVAIIIAQSAALAEDALAGVDVSYEALPPILDRHSSMADHTLLFEVTKTNIATVFNADKGDVDAAFKRADVIVRDQLSTQRQTALPMETRGLVAQWDSATQHLKMYGAAKLPFFNRTTMAAMMKLPPENVDYIEVDVGGGFGARGEFYPEDYLVAFAARTLNRPVKWIEDRREHFTAIGHSRESSCDVEMALSKDGTILGMRGDLFVNIGAYVRPNGLTPVRNAAQFMSGPYRIPNIGLKAHAFMSNKTPAGTYRGPGRYEGSYFIERLLDQAAAATGIDRLALRRKNLVTSPEMPYPLAPVLPSDGRAETNCDSGDNTVTFDRCVQEFNWEQKARLDGTCVDGLYHGLGIACFIEGGASGPSETARMECEADGSVSVYVGSSAIGQGLETIMSQIAADALELKMDRIKLYHGSTNLLKEGWGSYGSRGTVMGGSAVQLAAQDFIKRFRELAAEALNVPSDNLSYSSGRMNAPDGRSITLAELARKGISGYGKFNNATPTYTYGTAAVHVSVDIGTGAVNVLDYTVVDDVGKVINPLTLHGQVMGAAVQGFGSVFSEDLSYDDNGTPLVGTLADYLLPLATDYPHIHCVTMEDYPSPTNPMGAKGAGEGGIIPVGGATANAIASALLSFNVQPRDLPITPSKLWSLIHEKA